jgi:RNA-binding protein Musashi
MDQLTGLPLTSPAPGPGGGELGSQGESSGRSTPSSDSAPGKLFVGGLSWQTSQDKLREYFGQFGNVTDVLVMKDPITQVRRVCCSRPRGILSRAEDNSLTFLPCPH